jgi:RNA polymerase sigma-70 factor (ECF subfamily)
VAQEVFLAAYRRFPGDYGQAAGWVRVAAVHTALNVLRGERRRDKRQRVVQQVDYAAPSAEDTVIDREARTEIRRVLARLPRRSAAALVMRHGGMSYAEIAEALGIKVGHVGTLLRRAESALRKEIERETHS